MLRLENISKRYFKDRQSVQVLNRVSLDIAEGEFVAIQGASGCGKTTLLLVSGALLNPDEGQIIINGTEINNFKADQMALMRANNIGFVFQQYHLVPYLTVLDNIKLPVLAQKTAVPRNRLYELTSSLGLGERLQHTPAELSAGEKQRVALARALLFEPGLLLADEITGNLDRANAEIVMRCLVEYTNSGGAVLLVTHDKTAARYADRILSMGNGQLTGNKL